MVYIIASVLKKAYGKYDKVIENTDDDEIWKLLMLTPLDYNHSALTNPLTRKIMEKIEFAHGGPDYDSKYPEGIPTSVEIKTKSG